MCQSPAMVLFVRSGSKSFLHEEYLDLALNEFEAFEVPRGVGLYRGRLRCDKCGHVLNKTERQMRDWKYCPWCGAEY